MIAERHYPFVARLLARNAWARMRRRFDAIWAADLERFAALVRERPVLCVANHTSWWDGMFILALTTRLCRLQGFVMMNATHLAQHRFFALAGAFGVDLDSASDRARGILHARTLLDRPGRVLWIFPQGGEHPPHVPLRFEPGAARIAGLVEDAAVVPVGLRYVVGPVERPWALAAFGSPLPREADLDAAAGRSLQRGVQTALSRIDAHLETGDPAFVPLFARHLAPTRSFPTRVLDGVAGLYLAASGRRSKPRRALPVSSG